MCAPFQTYARRKPRDLKIDKYEAHFEQVVPSFMEKFLKGRNEEELGRQLKAEIPFFTLFFI